MSRPAFLLVSGLLLAACGGGEPTSTTTTVVYGGVFAGQDGTEAGNFTINVVLETGGGSGTFLVNGASHTLTAVTYDGITGAFSGTGSGGYSFDGTADDSIISGIYGSPTGGGLFTGLKKTVAVSPVTYCGTHIGRHIGDPIAGAFAFVQGGGTRRGVFTSVMEDPFHGELRSTSAASVITLDTLTGDASLAVTGGGFTGIYEMAAGDTGQMAGIPCRNSVTSPIISVFDGVLGSYDGNELGSLAFSLSSTGLGSTGTYKLGSVVTPFLAVISGVNGEVAAFDTDFRIIASLDTARIGGTYHRTGSVAGRVAGLARGTSTTVAYCGNMTGGGAFSFLFRSDSTLWGLYTGGNGSTFEGNLTGKPGDGLATLSSTGGSATVLPDPGSFGGFIDFPGGGTATITGTECP
jgi:hypothetical protein